MNTHLVIDAEIVLLALFVAFIIFSTVSIFALRHREEPPPERHYRNE